MASVIHVATVGDESFKYGVAALFQTICQTLNPAARVQFHVVDMNLQPATREALRATVKMQERALGITFLNPEESACFRNLREILLRSRPRAPFREKCWLAKFAIPDLLTTESRCLYLDSDILCGRDLGELNSFDWGQNWLLAARDLPVTGVGKAWEFELAKLNPAAPYFNGGFMYFDLAAWRRENLGAKAPPAFQLAPERMIDQGIFNLIYFGRWLVLDGEWNHQCPYTYGIFGDLSKGRKFLVHYVARPKPWQYPADARSAEFFAALDQTAYAGWRPNPLYWAAQYKWLEFKLLIGNLLKQLRRIVRR